MSFTNGRGQGLDELLAWEDAGAHWRLAELHPDHVIVELLACTGEPVDRLASTDPTVRSYVATRSSSSEEVRHHRP